LTQIMGPPSREILKGEGGEFGWLIDCTPPATSSDAHTDMTSVNEDVDRKLFHTRLNQVTGKDSNTIRDQVNKIFDQHFPHHPGFHFPHAQGGVLKFLCSSHTSASQGTQGTQTQKGLLYIRFHKTPKVYCVFG
jgi:hypothetical protein